MTAGIPGTGIGALYYILLALMMPVRETCRLCVRRSSTERWLQVAAQTGNALGILISAWLTGWLLIHAFALLRTHGLGSQSEAVKTMTNIMSVSTFHLALVVLGSVILSVHILRLLIPARKLPKSTISY
jgi:hypothetical protein